MVPRQVASSANTWTPPGRGRIEVSAGINLHAVGEAVLASPVTSAHKRPLDIVPSSSTSKTRMCARMVSLMNSRLSSSEKVRAVRLVEVVDEEGKLTAAG